jgi:hypothetical protein
MPIQIQHWNYQWRRKRHQWNRTIISDMLYSCLFVRDMLTWREFSWDLTPSHFWLADCWRTLYASGCCGNHWIKLLFVLHSLITHTYSQYVTVLGVAGSQYSIWFSPTRLWCDRWQNGLVCWSRMNDKGFEPSDNANDRLFASESSGRFAI